MTMAIELIFKLYRD